MKLWHIQLEVLSMFETKMNIIWQVAQMEMHHIIQKLESQSTRNMELNPFTYGVCSFIWIGFTVMMEIRQRMTMTESSM